ncbi:hypothetical protein BGZ57DRAFT_937491 [Hyaloscypha finlandica]|nr:hypothetical protein BGZ57DRAFT_937491 [Hyaloscypha finlandica]
MSKRLSILNDPPKVLEGPQLLHKLIRWDRHSEKCALDFTSGGTRQRYIYREIQCLVDSLERIKFVVEDVSAGLLITSSEFKDVVSWENGPIVILVDEFPVLPEGEIPQPGVSRGVTPEDLAYVMYTSGSSGTPKGVAVSHLAVSQSLLAHERHIPQFKRFLQFAAPSFDVSVFEIFFPFIRGCTLVGCDRSQLLNDLPGILNDLEVDAAELTPTVVGSLLQKRSNAPGLKLLLTIGEMLTTPIVEEFGASETKPCMLYGMYGPTEAAIHCTIYPEMAASTKPGNIGVPFDTVSTFIAAASTGPEDTANLKFLPVGELGELVLGGPQLAHGYLNREEQNKAAFVTFEGRNYYRTGDKARQLDDGTIEILGRMSGGQVKLRGQRVELGEIEEAVYKHPGVKTVSAIVLGGVLVVFTLVGDEKPSAEDVMKTCAKWLPKFMLPSEIILLRNFPYLPSGKVDKKQLVADYQQQRNIDGSESVANLNETGKAIKQILEELLGPFPAKMRLAAIGLDSLIAIRVSSKLRVLGFNVSTVAILNCDTLSSLTRICENSRTERSQVSDSPQRRTMEDVATFLNGNAKDVESTMLCTPLQTAMLAETAVDEKAYRNWVEIDLPETPDIQHVISTIRALSEANSILRTGFTESPDSDGYVQIIWKSFPDSNIEQVTMFNYEFDPLKDVSLHHPIRIQILQSSSSMKLLIHIHHALYDAWSLELLLDDLDTLLMAKSLAKRPPFADVVEGYADGILKYNDWASKDYWKDHLSHLDVRRIPSFHSRNAPPPGLSNTRLATSISTSEVEAAARRLSSSPQSLFQAAYALVLGSYLGSADICFGTVFSGRTLPIVGIEDIAGPCLATLPVRVDLSLSTTIQDLVRELNTTNRKHLEFCDVPLRDIKSASCVHPRQLLFDTLLIWQQTLHDHGHTRKHVRLVDTVDNLEFNLTIEIIPSHENIEMKANFQRSLFPESQIKNLLKQVEQLVRVIVEDETTPLEGVFDSLSSGVLSIENETPELGLKGESLSSPVERIAAQDPERTAINFARTINKDELDVDYVSYSELNSRANQMGNYLLAQNILPDELVCICLEKSTDFYTSILATAKIGAGYLPVTPDIPPERLEHIIREAKVKAVQGLTIVYIDEIRFTDFSSRDILSRSSPKNIAYCVFTSGSTGTPKGVLVTQGNLLSNLDILEDLYPVSKESRFLQSCSQAFDVSVFEIFFAWRDVLFRDIENAIRVLEVTHLSLTPTVASLIEPKKVPKVQFLVFNAWADRGLWQGYGPSETTNICTINPKVTRYDSINNIGPPFRNTSAFVLSPGPEFGLVPRGGEDHTWTELEQEIAAAAVKVAGVSLNEVGPETSFFSLGIDSISAISLSRVLRQSLDLEVEISDILKHPSVVRLANRLEFRGQKATTSENSSADSFDFGFDKKFLELTTSRFGKAGRSVQAILPCTPLQEAMLSAAESSRALQHSSKQQRSQNPSRIQRTTASFSLKWVEESIKKNSTSLLAILHTAWAHLLSEHLQETDILPINGIERLIAPCFNTIPIRLQNIHNLSYLEAFRKMQTLNADSLPFQLTPLRRLQSKDLDASICDDTLEIILHSYTSIFSKEETFALLTGFEGRIQTSLQNPRRQIFEKRETIELQQSRAEESSTSIFTDVPSARIGRDISIFRLARLRKQGHIVLASDILEHPTISQLNTYLLQLASKSIKVKEYDFDAFDRRYRETICSEHNLDAGRVEAVRPCTAVQKEYVNSLWLELLPGCPVSRVKAAWETVCRQHEMLRTGFASFDDPKHSFVMVIYAKENFSLPCLKNLLERPWALALLQDNGRSTIKFTAHHALYDAQSIQMILSDVAQAAASQASPNRPSIISLLGAILHNSEDDIEDQKLFWERAENKIVVNRFPDLTSLQILDHRSEVREASWARLLAAYIGERRSIHEEADGVSFPSIVTVPVRCDKWAGFPEGKIFDTLFTYQKLPGGFEDVEFSWKVVREEASVDYALTLRLTFRVDLIPPEQAELLLRQYDALLLDTLRNPDGPCDLAPDVHNELLSITPAKDYDIDGPQWPNKTALQFATSLEPGNTKSSSNKIAHLLLNRQATPGQIIVICLDKCAEASFAIIGILKAGSERLKFIIRDSGASLILRILDRDIIMLDSLDILAGCSSEEPQLSRDVTPHDGCLITHDNTVHFLRAFQRLFSGHWSEDSNVMEQFFSWSIGICVASAPRDVIFEDITGAIQQLGITHIDLTPSLARLVHPDDVPSLCKGAFITGGEQLKQEILDVWGEHAATIGCTMYQRVPKNGKPSNIGPQYDNLPVLRGGIGELCVSGKLVGMGYLNRPDLNEEKFPTLQADDQKSSSDLQEVQKEQLVSFFVKSSPEDGGSSISTMRDACKSRLPGYMVPTHFIPIKALPLNANNKADSKQLAAIYNSLTVDDLQSLSQSSQQDKEWTENERRVVQILAEAMHIERSALTRSSNMFELGLDSISIIGFSRALQNAGLENAKLSAVKNNPSIGGLVRALMGGTALDQGRENAYVAATQAMAAFSQRHMVDVCDELGIESADVETVAPCTPVQEGMIYRFLESEYPLYFNNFEFRLDQSVDNEKILAAWNNAVTRLQVLRTKFVSTNDGYAQVVLKSGIASLGCPIIDYDSAEKSLSLKTPYTLSLCAVNTLTLRIFHGLYDGNSLTLLLRRVVEEYRKLGSIEYGPSFTSSLPYGPLAQAPGAREFWSSHLEHWTPQTMPTISESTEDIVATATIDDLVGFEALRKLLVATPQAVIQAVWLSVLQNLISSNLTIGIVASGRAIDFEGADTVIGPLFNTIPFHIKLQPGISSGSLITKCHEFNMQMQDFQHTPLKDIQKWSPAKPGQSLFDTLFVFQRPEMDSEKFAKGTWTQVDGGQVADYPLAFEANLSPDSKSLDLTIVAQGTAITQARAADLLGQFLELLQETIQNSGRNIVSQHDGGRIENGRNDPEEKSHRALLSTPTEPFTWSSEALNMRKEIALLAKASEETIHENSSIFELGLDSIDVIKLSSRLKKVGIEIPVSAIIKSQTIASLSRNISSRYSAAKRASGKSLESISRELRTYLEHTGKLPVDVETVLPATPLQQSMVNEMTKSGYNVGKEKLMAAVKKVIEQSPILRTTFVEIGDPRLPLSYAQIIQKKLNSSTENFSIRILRPGEEFEDFMGRFKAESAALATEKQVLLQVHCVSAEQSKYLVIAISHALYDGTSLRSIHDDIHRTYHGELKPRPEFMPFLEEVFQSTTEEAKKFWRTTLSNLPPARFPREELSDDLDGSQSTRLERRSRVPLQKIEQLCKSSRITMQTLGQTCWALVLAHLMGQLDVVFGSVLSCRDSEDANEVISYMQDMSDMTRGYQHFPLGTAQAYALASRQDQSSTKDTALFDTLFIYQGRLYGASDVEFPVCVEMEISVAATDPEGIIDALETQTIITDPEGISVCGLPKFKKAETKTAPAGTQPINKVDDEWSSTEVAIRKALHEISDVPEEAIGKDSTIFHLGLDSILVLKLPALLKKYGIKLSVSDILREQTVNSMANAARGSKSDVNGTLDVDSILAAAVPAEESSSALLELEREVGEIQYIMPATAGELFMIRQWQTSQGAMFYQTFTYSLPGPIDRSKFETAWSELLGRHDILRTGFLEVGTDIAQVVFKNPTNEVIYHPERSNSKIRKHRKDLRLPPVSLVVEGAEASSFIVKIVLHHALYDGISLPILIKEFQSLYRGKAVTETSHGFKSFIAQSVSTPSPDLTKEKWKSYLNHGTLFPSRSTDDTAFTKSKKRTEVFHPLNQVSNIKQLAQDSGVSIDALFLAAASRIYASKLPSGSVTQVVFGIYLANRAPFGEDLSNLVAPTLNLLPLRVQDPLSRTIPELAKVIQKDIHMISSKEMVSASLANIYSWTGVRVNFFVNILKSANPGIKSEQESKREEWLAVQDLGKRAEVVDEIVNEDIKVPSDGRCDAYLPSVDLEFRYHREGNKLDMGIFAPTEMLPVEEAEGMIEEFLRVFE